MGEKEILDVSLQALVARRSLDRRAEAHRPQLEATIPMDFPRDEPRRPSSPEVSFGVDFDIP